MILTPGKNNKFTIVVAVYNAAATLERCLESIVNQLNTDWELIVVDGCSTDGSLQIVERFQNQISFWESKPDHGIYHAWNKALSHASGNWVCFLGADDFFWNEHVLLDLSPHLESALSNKIKIVYGRVTKVDARGNIIRVIGKPWQKIKWLMSHGMPLGLPHPGMMHHRSLFECHGMFDETFLVAGDYDFLLRELKNGSALFVGGICTVGSQIGGIADYSNLKTNMEVARAKKKNGLKPYSWVWIAICIRAFFRKLWRDLIKAPK